MKKLLALTLALVMALSLAACGSKKQSGLSNPGLPTFSLPASEPASTPAPTPTPEPVSTPGAPSVNDADPQQALLDYINGDLMTLGAMETQMINSYESVTGNNYTDDATTYNELNDRTLPLAQDLHATALQIGSSLRDTEINRVHSEYIDYAGKFITALGLMIGALEEQSYSGIANANDKLDEANQMAMAFQRDLRALADARGVDLG